ncbi:ribosome silencing factor [Mycolicibacterium tusciae]|uniref:ribosome silencing factor n=1 Tax=Mycolicibacterium tusciae TaxID=75922 RepID=UPI00024A4EE9|nr:ribosome silencing factor [Mycolicibacterium tusciae]
MSATEEAIGMATVAARAASSKLAEDVVVIDVSGQLVITDCFVIASAANERQVNAIVDEVEEKMRLAGHKPARREGAREGRWTLLDFVDIVVHIQHSDERDFYALDRLWRDCPVIAVDLDSDEPLARGPEDGDEPLARGAEDGDEPLARRAEDPES